MKLSHRPDRSQGVGPWALDFQFDQTADARILKLLHVVDEFTREALAIECQRRIDSDQTVAVLERLVAERGTAPRHVRCDNGPELTANALRDWCRFSQTASAYIEPGSPWQNPYVESFGSRIRDELLSVELFSCLTEAQVLIEDWRIDYNTRRPHSALHMMTPAAFAASCSEPSLGSEDNDSWGSDTEPASHSTARAITTASITPTLTTTESGLWTSRS